jgi:hypothetical protein
MAATNDSPGQRKREKIGGGGMNILTAYIAGQSKILRMVTNAPWYVTIQTLHDDLNVPFIKDIIQEKSINHHNKLGNHRNPMLQPLLEQQQRRKLKKLWPADLIDGLRVFTHCRGHHDTKGFGGRCLTQNISLMNVLNSDC